MRFRRLDLIRYGKFTDFRIDFPAPDTKDASDFHLIVGANEAGKSTTRNAITDLLFGIEARTRFDFIHDKKDMCVGGVLETDTSHLAFQRLKRNRHPLRSADGGELPDDTLAPFTGNADRTSFLREFCLDHAGLEAGGKNLMDSKDDVGRMLFEASAGVGIFGDFLDRLEQEASSLWTKGKSRSHAFYQAQDDFKKAQDVVRNATARTAEWRSVNQKIDTARVTLDSALNQYTALELTRIRLERIRRIHPHFQARNTNIEERAALGEVTDLPETASDDLRAAMNDMNEAEQKIRTCQAMIEKAKKERDGAPINASILSRKEDIEELREENSRIRNHPSDIAKQEAEVKILSGKISDLTRDLGWTSTDHNALIKRLPTALQRQEIEELASSFSGLCQAKRNATENVQEKERSLAMLTQELNELPKIPMATSMTSPLALAKGLGNTEEHIADINDRIHRASESLTIQIAKLAPWTGSAEVLRKLPIPSESEVQEFKERERNLVTELKAAKNRREQTKSDLKATELKAQQLKRGASPITYEEISVSREKRNLLWNGIKSGKKSIEKTSNDYEVSIATADALADNRYQNAEDAKELEILCDTFATRKLELENIYREIKEIEAQQKDLLTDWRVVIKKLGLDDIGISAFQTWLGHYRSALSEAEKLADEQANLQSLESRIAMAAATLRRAFTQIDGSESPTEHMTLQQLICRAETEVSTAEKSKSRREQLTRNIRQEKQNIKRLKEKETDSARELEDWNASWAKTMKNFLLPDTTTTQNALTASSLMTELKEMLDKYRDITQNGIITMQRDIENINTKAEDLAQAVASDAIGKTANEICTTLQQRLADTEKAQETYEKALTELKENQVRLDCAKTIIIQAKSHLTPHMERAKVNTVDDLKQAIEKSETFRKLTQKIDELTTTILENGDGLVMDEIEAEIEAEDISTISVRLTGINEQREQALKQRDERRSALKDAEQERDRTRGQADAALAESKRQEALAHMADIIQRYIKVYMGAQLLRWSIERYRDEKRGPLLERASEIFSILTLGSFKTLQIDYEGDTAKLMGCRPNGKHVDFEGLSEGTGDQLFLSLRLAAVENQLRHAQPLPFIADDLFINYDDNRAAQGFKALGELATKSQVIYFTHHEHLIEIAQKAICADLNVTRL